VVALPPVNDNRFSQNACRCWRDGFFKKLTETSFEHKGKAYA